MAPVPISGAVGLKTWRDGPPAAGITSTKPPPNVLARCIPSGEIASETISRPGEGKVFSPDPTALDLESRQLLPFVSVEYVEDCSTIRREIVRADLTRHSSQEFGVPGIERQSIEPEPGTLCVTRLHQHRPCIRKPLRPGPEARRHAGRKGDSAFFAGARRSNHEHSGPRIGGNLPER